MSNPYRVIVWGPGNVGTQLLHLLYERPEFEVAGVLCYSPSKDGTDVGEYLGHAPSGVKMSSDKQSVFAQDADVVIISARGPDCTDEDVTTLLRSGKNVIASGGFSYPEFQGPEQAARLAEACKQGGTTLHGTGEFPGIFLDRIALTLTGLTVDVDTLTLEEFANMAGNQGLSQWERLGINGPADRASEMLPIMRHIFLPAYSEAIAIVCRSLFAGDPEIDMQVEFLTTDEDLIVDGGTIHKGMTDRVKFTYTAAIEGRVRLTVIVNWCFVGDDVWRIEFDGDPISMRAEFNPKSTPKRKVRSGTPSYPAYSDAVASVLLQAIPLTCEAQPGFLYPSVFANAVPDMKVLGTRKSIADI